MFSESVLLLFSQNWRKHKKPCRKSKQQLLAILQSMFCEMPDIDELCEEIKQIFRSSVFTGLRTSVMKIHTLLFFHSRAFS